MIPKWSNSLEVSFAPPIYGSDSVADFRGAGGKTVVSTEVNKLLDVALTENTGLAGESTSDLALRISFLVKETPHHKLDIRELTISRDDREEAEKWIKTALDRAYSGQLRRFCVREGTRLTDVDARRFEIEKGTAFSESDWRQRKRHESCHFVSPACIQSGWL